MIVGAPLYSTIDNIELGRVYIFKNNVSIHMYIVSISSGRPEIVSGQSLGFNSGRYFRMS